MGLEESRVIRNFIMQSCNLDALEDDCDIFEERIANSLFVIELMTFIENEFAIKVTTDDLSLKSFNSVASIEDFLACKRG